MSTTPQSPDFSRFARKPSERVAIVEHVYTTPDLQETDYLEWKAGYDLSKRPGAAATARQLIGMANRDAAHAIRHADGHAYVLLGVEPGNIPGVPEWDSADIEKWLTPFVGPDLHYDTYYVRITGHTAQVLFLTIDPPSDGDPIYNLLQTSEDPDAGKTIPAGTIFVRHGSNTRPHTPADVARLAARANPARETALDLGVELDASKVAVIDPHLLTDEHRDNTLSSLRSQMRAALPRREAGHLAAFNIMRPVGETRSESDYTSEIDLYVQTVKRANHIWWGIIAQEWLEAGRSILGVSVVNHSEENYENTVLELTFNLSRFNVYLHSREVEDVMHTPERPLRWGTSLIHSIAQRGIITPSRDPEPEIERIAENQTLVRYPELRVRPHTRHALKPLLLALGPPLAGTVFSVHWRVTASNTKSDKSGDIELKVAPFRGNIEAS